MDLRNKTTSEFRTVFLSPLGVPNSQVSLYLIKRCCLLLKIFNMSRPSEDLVDAIFRLASGLRVYIQFGFAIVVLLNDFDMRDLSV